MISGFADSSGIEYLLQSYRQIEERPIRTLESRKQQIDKRISLFNDLKSQLAALKSIAKTLGYTGATSVFGKKAATSSEESVVTVTAASSATVTTHTLLVSQLARADKVISSQYDDDSTDIFQTLGEGSFIFQVTVNGTTTDVSVDIAADEDNETILNNIVTAVNNTADVGIKASVIKDTDSTSRLVFTSEETGADFEMGLADSSGNLLNTIGMNDSVEMNGTSGGYIYESAELNAILTIDGVQIIRNSNTIEDSVNGLTFTLKKTQEATEQPVVINVTNDVSGIKSKIEDFVGNYNKVLDFVKTNTSTNKDTRERARLSGDYSVTNLRFQLREAIADPVTGLDDGFPTILSAIGISTDREGKLSISDSDKLEDYLTEHLDQVEALFNSEDGYASRITNIVDEMLGGEGIIEKRKDVLQNQITSINHRIENLRKQVDKKLEHYRNQFAQMQAALAAFNSQMNYISALNQSSITFF